MGRFIAYLKENWLRIYFLLSIVLLVFCYGVAVGLFKIFPYETLEDIAAAGIEWMKYPRHKLRLEPQKFLYPARHDGKGVVQNVGGKAFPGATFLEGYFGNGVAMRLIDMEGRTHHEWRVSFNDIWTKAPHLASKPHDWDIDIHGALLYPNGDVVFNFQYGGLVRLDKCSRVLWKLAYQTHHSIFQDTDGNLWVPGRKLRETASPKFPKLSPPFFEEFILKVSPDGKILREISVLDAIYGSEYEGVMFANSAHRTRIDVPKDHDFSHLNDIEVLSEKMAPAFALFKAGDILVSLRNFDLLMLLSPDTGLIKWCMTGPYIRQHDPDFLPNGHISIFDNRRDGDNGNLFGGSRIVEVDPVSAKAVTLYGDKESEHFYTERQGEQQQLPNGNLLITESEAGHAFEVTADGEVVWSFINRWDNDSVAIIGRATRYPEYYLKSIEKEGCDD